MFSPRRFKGKPEFDVSVLGYLDLEKSDYFVWASLSGVGRDSSVGIASRYELDGPGIECRWGRDFQHQSRPVLGPTQPSVQWVPGRSRG
jgi:hypothetical protein